MVCHSMYSMHMSKNDHVNREPVSCLIYHISNVYDFDVFFGGQLQTMCTGGL